MVDEALSRMSLSEISVAIANREVSSQEAVRNSLEQLEKRGPSLNCLARLFPEQAVRLVLLKMKILGPTLKII